MMTPIKLQDIHDNIRKFLMLITFTEGTDRQKTPYNELFGFTNFTGYDSHPNIKIKAANYSSTAAGRYQILYRTYLALKKKFPEADFSPEWQDRFAIELIKEANGYRLAKEGKWVEAINEVNNVWASLPGSPYGQPTVSMARALKFLNSI